MNIKRMFALETGSHELLDDPNSGFIAGMECEIESVIPGQDFAEFARTEDGSLRNNGLEYISKPMTREFLLSSFKNLHAKIKFHNKEVAFSSRTSTHVHVNCRHLEKDQVKNIILLYALFEECFFNMVNPDRRNNIHCVPLTETIIPTLYREELVFMYKRWHKYTALNVLPLGKIGTLEFRHMQGTGDATLINEWLTTLENLWNLGKVISLSPDTVSRQDVRMLWYDTLFGHSHRMIALRPAVPMLIKNSVIDVKRAFVGV